MPGSNYAVIFEPTCQKRADYLSDSDRTTFSVICTIVEPSRNRRVVIALPQDWPGRQTTITQDSFCIAMLSANLIALCFEGALPS